MADILVHLNGAVEKTLQRLVQTGFFKTKSEAVRVGILKLGKEYQVIKSREELKQMVMGGRLRLMLGTDAASEGLNLHRLARLINLDLPWNPTRLEQRKGRIQRIGQIHDTVEIYDIR